MLNTPLWSRSVSSWVLFLNKHGVFFYSVCSTPYCCLQIFSAVEPCHLLALLRKTDHRMLAGLKGTSREPVAQIPVGNDGLAYVRLSLGYFWQRRSTMISILTLLTEKYFFLTCRQNFLRPVASCPIIMHPHEECLNLLYKYLPLFDI